MAIGTSDGTYHEDEFDHVASTFATVKQAINEGVMDPQGKNNIPEEVLNRRPVGAPTELTGSFKSSTPILPSGSFIPGSTGTVAPTSPAYEQAKKDLNLNTQEQMLYERHLTNLNGHGGVDNPDGSRSTLFQTSFEYGGRTYNAPTVYDGKIIPPKDAVDKAFDQGIHNFPSYGSSEEAESRYNAMHGYMEKDTQEYLKSK